MMFVADILTLDHPYAKTTDKVHHVIDLMDDFKLEQISLLDQNNKLIGVLTEEMLNDIYDVNSTLAELPFEFPSIYLSKKNIFFDALILMQKHQLSSIPVIDNDKLYLGEVNNSEVLKELFVLSGADRPGGIIILEMDPRDYSTSKICRLVEENNVKILSLMSELTQKGKLLITLKLDQMQLDNVLQTFSRHEYQVKLAYHHSVFQDDLNERYEGLMNYLNI